MKPRDYFLRRLLPSSPAPAGAPTSCQIVEAFALGLASKLSTVPVGVAHLVA